MTPKHLFRHTLPRHGMLFEWMASACCKSLITRMFLFEWKTST